MYINIYSVTKVIVSCELVSLEPHWLLTDTTKYIELALIIKQIYTYIYIYIYNQTHNHVYIFLLLYTRILCFINCSCYCHCTMQSFKFKLHILCFIISICIYYNTVIFPKIYYTIKEPLLGGQDVQEPCPLVPFTTSCAFNVYSQH